MKTLIYSFLIVLFYTTATFSQTSTPNSDKLEAEITELFNSNAELFHNRDLDGLVNRFTPDGSLKTPGSPRIQGHDALRERYARNLNLELIDFNFAIKNTELSETGDIAVANIDFEISFSTPNGPVSNSGGILMVLKRINDEWKIFAESMSPGPVDLSEE